MKKLLLIIPILLIAALFFVVPRVLIISQIDCTSQYGPCDGELSQQLKQSQGKNYLIASKNTEKLLKEQRDIANFSLRFLLPTKLAVEILGKKPIVAFKSAQTYFLMDKEGYILERLTENNLPVIVVSDYDPGFEVGKKVSEKEIFGAKILQKAYLIYNVSQSQMNENKLDINLSNGKKIIFPLEGDIDVLFGSLTLVLSRLNSTYQTSFAIIDLRYKNPVLK